jgi:XTP/dITP diphosphohydrolase
VEQLATRPHDRIATRRVHMKILLATSNPHKLQEIQAVFTICAGKTTAPGTVQKLDIELMILADMEQIITEPIEDQNTFEGNAALKARYYANHYQHWCIADDSGLEVDALNGQPGVHSARYSGVEGDRPKVDPANNQLLLERLKDIPSSDRSARFVCAMALCPPDREQPVIEVRGTIEGRILGPGDVGYAIDNPLGRGNHGFGYDPLFLVPELGKTTAQLEPQEKNAISHRGQAARNMWKRLAANYPEPDSTND